MLTILGLSLICVAWIYQLYLLVGQKETMIKSMFVSIYSAGVLLLVADGFMSGINSITWLNLISFVVALMVLVILLKKKQI